MKNHLLIKNIFIDARHNLIRLLAVMMVISSVISMHVNAAATTEEEDENFSSAVAATDNVLSELTKQYRRDTGNANLKVTHSVLLDTKDKDSFTFVIKSYYKTGVENQTPHHILKITKDSSDSSGFKKEKSSPKGPDGAKARYDSVALRNENRNNVLKPGYQISERDLKALSIPLSDVNYKVFGGINVEKALKRVEQVPYYDSGKVEHTTKKASPQAKNQQKAAPTLSDFSLASTTTAAPTTTTTTATTASTTTTTAAPTTTTTTATTASTTTTTAAPTVGIINAIYAFLFGGQTAAQIPTPTTTTPTPAPTTTSATTTTTTAAPTSKPTTTTSSTTTSPTTVAPTTTTSSTTTAAPTSKPTTTTSSTTTAAPGGFWSNLVSPAPASAPASTTTTTAPTATTASTTTTTPTLTLAPAPQSGSKHSRSLAKPHIQGKAISSSVVKQSNKGRSSNERKDQVAAPTANQVIANANALLNE